MPTATVDDVARIASQLPEVTEPTRHGHGTWFVGGKGFVWERPYSKADLRRFGDVEPRPAAADCRRCTLQARARRDGR